MRLARSPRRSESALVVVVIVFQVIAAPTGCSSSSPAGSGAGGRGGGAAGGAGAHAGTAGGAAGAGGTAASGSGVAGASGTAGASAGTAGTSVGSGGANGGTAGGAGGVGGAGTTGTADVADRPPLGRVVEQLARPAAPRVRPAVWGVRWRVGFGRRVGAGAPPSLATTSRGRRWRHRSRRDGGGGVLVERHRHGHDRGRCQRSQLGVVIDRGQRDERRQQLLGRGDLPIPTGSPRDGIREVERGSCSVQVTQAAPNVGDILEGTFTATLANPAHTQTKQVTNGRFRVPRVAEPPTP